MSQLFFPCLNPSRSTFFLPFLLLLPFLRVCLLVSDSLRLRLVTTALSRVVELPLSLFLWLAQMLVSRHAGCYQIYMVSFRLNSTESPARYSVQRSTMWVRENRVKAGGCLVSPPSGKTFFTAWTQCKQKYNNSMRHKRSFATATSAFPSLACPMYVPFLLETLFSPLADRFLHDGPLVPALRSHHPGRGRGGRGASDRGPRGGAL